LGNANVEGQVRLLQLLLPALPCKSLQCGVQCCYNVCACMCTFNLSPQPRLNRICASSARMCSLSL
jgi:hypothetical protein